MTFPAATADTAITIPAERAAAVPLTLYLVLFASTSVMVGVLWDISWHQTIGRDTFWTPAHLAIYLGGIVAGFTCGWLALHITFAGSAISRALSVRFWGFLAPFGAWVCIWGALAMVTSAPFDDSWHNTYGLDVKILSPPHAVLALGIGGIQIGAMLMAIALQNRSGDTNLRLQRLFLYAAGLHVVMMAILASEFLDRWDMHRASFYQVAALVFPVLLVNAARASRARWPATGTAVVYMGVTMLMIWILQMFDAEPLLGPIYVRLDRFVPTAFPLLIVAPAIAIDLVMRRSREAVDSRASWNDWRLALVLGIVFIAAFVPAQWLFADFYMSPGARNWVFAAHLIPYMVDPSMQARWYQFNPPDNLASGFLIAAAIAIVSARCGLWSGTWMSRVRR
jgi:hypothetical protein